MYSLSDHPLDPHTLTAVRAFLDRAAALFGSRARGDARPDRDVALLIIRKSHEPGHRRVIPADRPLRGMGIPKDIIRVTPEEIEEWRSVPSHVVTRGLREGVVLYDENAI